MLLILGVVALGGAAFVAGRWWLHRYDALGRPRRFPSISVSLLVVLAIALALPTVLRHREEAKLDKVASVLVGSHATVHCETFGQTFTETNGDLGFVKFGPGGVPERHTTIMRGPCEALKHYYGGDQADPSQDEIVAVHILTHESMHMRGQPVENLAECEAVQRDAETAQLLGATPQEGLALAEDYWHDVYPRMPSNYTTSQCSSDAALDEHLPDPPWAPAGYVAVKLPPDG